jgi:flagellar motor switch/type III secretory pathway protein FliN
MLLCRIWSPFCLPYQRMATAQPPPAPAGKLPQEAEKPSAAELAAELALVPAPHPGEEGGLIARGGPVARLPVELDVAVPVREFRVRNLLGLALGQVIETQWAQGADMPLAAGDVQLAWSEFEVVDSQLAVRVTRLA